MACGPKYFKCKFGMPSRPAEERLSVLPTTSCAMREVKGAVMFMSKRAVCRRLSICLS